MAPLSFSPTASISSHTLSAQSAQAPPTEPNQHSSQALVATLSSSPHSFLQPTQSLHAASLVLAKQFLDPLAGAISEAQTVRRDEARRKRKRGEKDIGERSVLGLKRVHFSGFEIDQIWEQAKRVLDATHEELEETLPEVQDDTKTPRAKNDGVRVLEFDEEEFEVDPSSDEHEESGDGLDSDQEDLEYDMEGDLEDDSHYGDMDNEAFHTEDDESIARSEEEAEVSEEEAGDLVEDPNGLNDGFFSIDDFNRQSQFLERQDERGDDDGAASDEDDIDWETDPLATKPGMSRSELMDMDQYSSDEEDGPTFGNADLHAPMSDSDEENAESGVSDEEGIGTGGMTNTNNIMYADFFAPPAKKKSKTGRPHPHNFPAKKFSGDKGKAPEAPSIEEVQRTMDAVHRDLFSHSDPNDTDDSLSDVDPSDPKSRKSNHERRQAKILEEIRRLEAANVAKRQWAMSGEAQVTDRPLNSLLEEDLDFERTGKPVPVITNDVSEDIEALIKRRILNKDFDELIRRRPDDLATGPTGVRRGRFELDDTKSRQGLAEIYEEEHLRRTDPNYVDQRDEKLRKEHAEIEKLWKDVSGKLDALCSWNYRPRPVGTSLDIRTDAPAITMEDARPSAGGDMGSASMLAPQEVYKPGEEKSKVEVHTKGGLPVAREELSREQKLRRRRREKERIKKAGGNPGVRNESQASKDKKQLTADLKKGAVKRIAKSGDLVDAEGNAIREGQRMPTGQNFKL